MSVCNIYLLLILFASINNWRSIVLYEQMKCIVSLQKSCGAKTTQLWCGGPGCPPYWKSERIKKQQREQNGTTRHSTRRDWEMTVLSVSESCKRQVMLPCFTALFPYSTIYTVQAEEKEFMPNYIQICWKSFGRIYSPIRLYLHFICRGNLIWPQDYKVSDAFICLPSGIHFRLPVYKTCQVEQSYSLYHQCTEAVVTFTFCYHWFHI